MHPSLLQTKGTKSCLLACSDDLPIGTRRRVSVACQLINASPLLVLHDVLDGIQEGDALAIMRCLQDFCRYALLSLKLMYRMTSFDGGHIAS